MPVFDDSRISTYKYFLEIMDKHLPRLSGWGRLSVPGVEVRSEELKSITKDAVLSRGLGRSYGDSSLPPPGKLEVVGTTLADRFLSFDEQTGVLRAEAGLSLYELHRVLMPRGWFTPVSPGTQFVTLGGMVASDVHGKNHHCEGTIGKYIRSILLRVADGRILTCSPETERELFCATLGGMGLTGHILEVEMTLCRIPSPWIYSESERILNIDRFVDALKESSAQWPFTVGWIDCLSRGKNMGRGILICGRWARPEEAPRHFPEPTLHISVPFEMPSWLMGPWTIRIFNLLYYWKHWSKKRVSIVHPDSFFYPLDRLRNWNRLYGADGVTQYQCVVPDSAGRAAVKRVLDLLTRLGGSSFLCVIKDCGQEGAGLLSFPKPGISIALDIPVRKSTQVLIDKLNEQVLAEGGRIYLTKDAFSRPEHFRAMEPRLENFLRVRNTWDPAHTIRSAQSVRLLGDSP